MGILPPLTPVILYYKYDFIFLPKTSISALNLFVITLFFSLLFKHNINNRKRLLFLLLCMVLCSNSNLPPKLNKKKVAVVQVGLYFKQGGRHDTFYNDLKLFLSKNNVDIVVFSENVYYGYKNHYIAERTRQLIKKIEQDKLFMKHPILLSFYGYEHINNVVAVYWSQQDMILRQKEILVPFFEKGVFGEEYALISDRLNQPKSKNKHGYFTIDNLRINARICYDALFPSISEIPPGLTIIQSDYSWLNNGDAYKDTILNGSILSRFSANIHSPLINIQNYGGTFVISNDWEINWDVYSKSLYMPFIVVEI
ncbi:apolipoprotein acyltransferase [Escherichia coli O51]|nr:apolipoprotein acyltransferase [Escherichia coli O51]